MSNLGMGITKKGHVIDTVDEPENGIFVGIEAAGIAGIRTHLATKTLRQGDYDETRLAAGEVQALLQLM